MQSSLPDEAPQLRCATGHSTRVSWAEMSVSVDGGVGAVKGQKSLRMEVFHDQEWLPLSQRIVGGWDRGASPR